MQSSDETTTIEATGADILDSKGSASIPLKLVVQTGPSAGKDLVLRAGTFLIGKGASCDLTLDDPSVSRLHLEVAVLTDRVRFRDLDSTNGSFCNGVRFREIEGEPGLVISLGKSELLLQRAESAKRELLKPQLALDPETADESCREAEGFPERDEEESQCAKKAVEEYGGAYRDGSPEEISPRSSPATVAFGLSPKITVERRREMVKLPEIQGERSQIVIGDYDGDCRRSISEEIGRSSSRATVTFGLSQRESLGRLIGRSAAMRRVFAILERVAPTDAAVVLEGETGTGKDLCAEAIHEYSPRANRPFVVVDLAGVQPNLIESELFGHVRGSFSGAVSDRAGAFERADGGTIFLDEIAELTAELQPRLLRALENRQSKRVGANEYKSFDIRVLAATNQNLEEAVKAGTFREDLYHRLGVVKIELPPLRERPEDVPLLVEKILESMGRETMLGPRTLALLSKYDWPGNVRELRNVVERAVSLGDGSGEVPAELLALRETCRESSSVIDLPFKEAKEQLINAFERDYLEHLVARCKHNVSQAARQAGIDRVYLHRLLKKHQID